MERPGRFLLPALLFLAGFVLIFIYLGGLLQLEGSGDEGPAKPVGGDEPLTTEEALSATATPAPTREPEATATIAVLPTPVPTNDTAALVPHLPQNPLERFGMTGRAADLDEALAAGLRFGNYASWQVVFAPVEREGVTFWQLIRLSQEGVLIPWEELAAAVAADPGAYWIIGNEPDVVVQDNVTPQRYAELYHRLYTFIKARDPTARIVIGGVSQPTPLRLAYLDIVLETYHERYGRPMPVDVWNIHAFILREERDSWGIGIPPGMSDDLAIRYEVEDHADMAIFRQNIVNFRAWMAERGYADRPLVVSEYGFLMPHDFGFPPEEVAEFMTASFDYFLSARNESGYPADDHRLVQWWFWFVFHDGQDEFSASFLYDRSAGQLTPLGEAYVAYLNAVAPDQ